MIGKNIISDKSRTQVTETDGNFISGRDDYVGYYERRQNAMKGQVLKILGFVGILLGFGSTIVSNIASEKTMKEEVAKEVAKALQQQK